MKNVTIYTKPMCPYCDRAKALFNQLDVPYTEIDVIENPEIRDEMAKKYNWATVPMILVGEEFIGGYDDMRALHEKGELLPKIED